VKALVSGLLFDHPNHMIPEGERRMNPTRWPTWVLALIGIVTIIAGALGVTHAPPMIGKVTWGVIIVLGVIAVGSAVRRRQAPTRR
jgi:hypothetical protein